MRLTHGTQIPPIAQRLVLVLLEAMAGRRALHQVRPLLQPKPFARLASYADTGNFRRMLVGPVRAQMPHAGAIEAAVTLRSEARPVSCARISAGTRGL